ncbi:MAG: nucleotide sugar dehydrogenase [Bacteroidota bacterium]
MYSELQKKEKTISVTGLGYVGLPLALAFAKHFRVIGFDLNAERVEMMRNRIDPSRELEASAFDDTDITFTTNPLDLAEAHFHIVGVPTDIDKRHVPNLSPLLKASKNIGKIVKKGDYVVFESTVYPGCTEEDCLPIIEKHSGLRAGEDFKFGYSPERINPGDKERTLTKILKVVAGCDDESRDEIADIYGHIIEAGVFKADSVKVAEAAKVIENTQRDLNIGLMNELAMIFDRLDIDTKAVLEAAGTKWNFLNFKPGLVGGHCIGVDPYYLTHKAQELGFVPRMILSGRGTNEVIPRFVANKLLEILLDHDKNPRHAKVLVMGITFKENVSDIRNSKIIDLVRELRRFKIEVEVVDPYADATEVYHEYKLELTAEPASDYDAVIVAVSHEEYLQLNEADFKAMMNQNPILFDLKGVYPRSKEMAYWRL